MRDHLSAALVVERKAAAEPSEFRAQCYRRLASLAVEAHVEQIAQRVEPGSSVGAELGAMIDAANAHLLKKGT